MRFNLGLTGVIATTMLLLASTTNAAITTTDSSYQVLNNSERANRSNQFLAQLLAGLEYAHMNNLLVYPDHNNLCFDASGNLMFKVLGEGDITQQGTDKHSAT
ncbi:hypothetical protein BDF22DRAFT_657462 [Syncephalis plumigaleata]|nr:hypothetical protein BDF22DRAFT_657462 [Syncephalis plumigaleata]